jgi:hypothetical protein
MRKSDIDKILYTQLIIARMGEKELMNGRKRVDELVEYRYCF